MNKPQKLFQTQQSFAAHIRDPEHVAAPSDVEDRRMAIYRDLFYNNIKGLLANNFPVIRALLNDAQWNELVRDFYVEHRAHTPLFPEMPKEFLRYLQDVRQPRDTDLPFLLELAHYEWVELALSLDGQDLSTVEVDTEGDLLEGRPALSLLAWPLSYRWPVHQIRPDYQPTTPPDEPTHLLAYRNRDDEVRFMALNPVSARLIGLMKETPGLTGHEYLQHMAEELQSPDPETIVAAGHEILKQFRQRDVILGTHP